MPGVWQVTLGTSAMVFDGHQAHAWLVRHLPESQAERLQRLVAASPELRQRLEQATDEADPLIQAVRRCITTRPQVSDEALLDEILGSSTTPPDSSSWKPPDSEATLIQSRPGTLAVDEPTSTDLSTRPETIRDYRLLEIIGEGGMGTVYRAMHLRLKKIVAIKVLLREATLDRGRIARFEREMEAIGRLQHPHIVAALDAGETDGAPYLVMEYVEGLDAAQLVALSGRLSVPDACEIARQAALGLQHIHSHGLVHRDIKPSNLILTRPMAGADSQVKLLDLGLALLTADQASTLTQTDRFMGTLSYMAPEQADRPHEVDIRADLYSLGCTLYFLISGDPPFPTRRYPTVASQIRAQAQDPPEPLRLAMPSIPPALDALVLRLLAKSPADRFDTPANVAAALSPFCAGSNLSALFEGSAPPRPPRGDQSTAPGTSSLEETRSNPAGHPVRAARSAPFRYGAAGVAGVVLLAVVLLSHWPWRERAVPRAADPARPSTHSPPSAAEARRTTTPSGLDVIEIPAGTFVMGSTKGDESPQRQITITAPLLIGVTEVTRGQFSQFITATNHVPDSTKGGHGFNKETGVLEGPDPRFTWKATGWTPYDDDHPVVNVSWNDAVAFCNWLSEAEGRTPCYMLTEGKVSLVPGTGYRLPTEAEWEYVCRLTTHTLDDRDEPGPPRGWALAGYPSTAPVRLLAVTPPGLQGMLGSVWEWCEDWYDADFYSAAGSRSDPHGPLTGTARVHRGGSWINRADVCRAACRGWAPAETCEPHLGFRVVRSAVRPLPKQPRSPARLRARPASTHSAWDDLDAAHIAEADRSGLPPEVVAVLAPTAEGSTGFTQAFAVESTIVTVDGEGRLRQWKRERSGLAPKYIAGRDSQYVILACDRRRSRLLTREKFGARIHRWQPSGDAIADINPIDTGPVTSAAFSQDGTRVALGGEGHVELWDLRGPQSEPSHTLPYSLAEAPTALAFAAGDEVLLANIDLTLYHWNLRDTPPLARADRSGRTLGLESARNALDMAVYGEGRAGLWRVTPSGLREFARHSTAPDARCALSPDGRRLAFAQSLRLLPAEIRILETSTGEVLQTVRLPQAVGEIDWAQDGRHLVTRNENGTVYVVRLEPPN